jgi:hypothetical protein
MTAVQQDQVHRVADVLVATPIDSSYDRDQVLREPAAGDSYQLWGRCHRLCLDRADNLPDGGQTIEDHGQWCQGPAYLYTEGLDYDGEHCELWGRAVWPYVHGRYARTATGRVGHPLNRQGRLEIRLIAPGVEPDHAPPSGDEDDEKRLYFSAGEARRLAAALSKIADQLDGLDQ